MTRRAAAVLLTAALAATLAPALSPGPAVTLPAASALPAAESASPGAAGIGDAYFPLDGNGGIDVLSYDVHDRYRFAGARLSGWTRVTLRATSDLTRFDLDFLLPVDAVTVRGEAVPYRRADGHELVVRHRLQRGERVSLVIRYDGRPGSYEYAGEHNWLADRHEVVAMNEPHMAPWWFPANDHPRDRAAMRISITAPRANRVVANGRLVSREVRRGLATTTWRADEPMVPYLAFFAAGPFQVAHGVDDGLPWYVAVSRLLSPSEQQVAMSLMKRTPALVDWLETQLGDYPFSVTGGLTTSLSPGFALENQTRPTYPYWGGGSEAVSTVVHELAHQWFGDAVSVDLWRDVWLNEGAATFMEARYAETHGGGSADRWLRSTYGGIAADDGFWRHRVADPCPSHEACVNSIFAEWVYLRGGMALQALRNVLGEDDFWTLLRRWVAERSGRTGSTAVFEALAEEVGGQDLDGFFDAWLHSSGKPADTAANGLG